MGCASSTPMITTGSEMLKAASHVAEDAAKSAENAVQDVTQSLGKTLDTAKETVGTAVTGIAHDLSNALRDKTDEAKNNILETLHLNGGGGGEATTAAPQQHNKNATGDSNAKRASHNNDDDNDDEENGDVDIVERSSRAPTPTPARAEHQDNDSLKTSTPEPEIEQALANQLGEDSPPTPKPNISELERLSAELHENQTETDAMAIAIADAHNSTSAKMTASASTSTLMAGNAPMTDTEKAASESMQQRRPSTTEWEKYADLLARNQKFHPNEIALRRRLLGAHGSLTKIPIIGLTAAMPTNEHLATLITNSNTTTINATNITTTNTTTTAAMPTALMSSAATATATANKAPRKIVAPQYFRDFPRSKQHDGTQPAGSQFDDESGQSDRNYDGGSTSSPNTQPTRSNARVLRYKKPRAFTTATVKKMHRQLTSLIGLAASKSTTPSETFVGHRAPASYGGVRRFANRSALVAGRNFDFNPGRMRIGSPASMRRRSSTTLLPPLRYGRTMLPSIVGQRLSSPIKLNANVRQQRSRTNAYVGNHTTTTTPPAVQLMSSSSSASRIGLHSLGHINSPILTKVNSNHQRSLSRSSRSSTANNSLTLKSNCTTPISRAASKSPMQNFTNKVNSNVNTALIEVDVMQQYEHENHPQNYATNGFPSTNAFDDDYCGDGGCNGRCYASHAIIDGRKTPIYTTLNNSPLPIKNTSSFLSSPRTSPFTPRKSYDDFDDRDYHSKAIFIADLSSVNENRNLLTPSPYKIRERCAVCYKKYVVK